jgi:hypothetical protein
MPGLGLLILIFSTFMGVLVSAANPEAILRTEPPPCPSEPSRVIMNKKYGKNKIKNHQTFIFPTAA